MAEDKAQTQAETDPPPGRASRQLLELDDLTVRDFVKIHGEPFELRNPGELSILEDHRMGRKGQRVAEIQAKGEDLSDEDVVELTRILDELLESFLIAPEAVRGALSDVQKLQVIGAFTRRRGVPAVDGEPDAPEPEAPEPEAPAESPSPSTGER